MIRSARHRPLSFARQPWHLLDARRMVKPATCLPLGVQRFSNLDPRARPIARVALSPTNCFLLLSPLIPPFFLLLLTCFTLWPVFGIHGTSCTCLLRLNTRISCFQGSTLSTRIYAPLPTHAALISAILGRALTTCLHDGSRLPTEGTVPSYWHV